MEGEDRMTTVYLIRHSIPFKEHRGINNSSLSLLEQNITVPLSIEGEKLADSISNNNEYKNIDTIWSSDYSRALSTAKYFAFKNNQKVNISSSFNERIHGVNLWSELPIDFEEKQLKDENYKINNGESQIDVRKRMLNELYKVINENKDKRIIIVGHATAFTFLLKEWCKIDGNKIFYNDLEIFNGIWNYCETFKLTFDSNNHLNAIKNIKNL